MANLDVNDAELGRRLHKSRQAIHAKRTGRSSMTADELAEIAEALEVDPAIMLGPPHEAVQWLVHHRREVLDSEAARAPGLPSTLELRSPTGSWCRPTSLRIPIRDGRVRAPQRAA
jgi:transcriptional regulator with XRE-family HTH domain